MGGWIETRGDRYRARFRVPGGGGTVGESFTRRRDAKAWLAKQERDAARGAWIDPRDAKVRFGAWAREWQTAQLHHRETTAKTTASRLDAHILPTFDDSAPPITIVLTCILVLVEYDTEANATYIRLAEGAVARTVAIDELVLVDEDADGNPIGVEVLTVPAPH